MTKSEKLTKIKLVCVALTLILLFSVANILISEAYGDASVAMAETLENTQTYANSSVTGGGYASVDGFLFPNYDTEEITDDNLTKPNVQTFGKHPKEYYPSYTNKLASADFDNTVKQEILTENQEMLANTKTWFEAGTLRTNLKKHVSADGQFSNSTNYAEAARIEKVIAINNVATPRKRSLGVFAPAGEVLTVTIDASLVGKLTVIIGYPYGDCDIGSGKFGRWPNDRMARFYLEFPLNKEVTEIGSPLGGMVMLNGVNANLGNFSIKISGGIDMPSYKLGVSTKEDWKEILEAPAPYVWLLTPYQYFVMPKCEISDIEDPYNALLWWHKASMISIYGMVRDETAHFYTPVISIYDSYVFVGEAVATVWQFWTLSPKYWCHGILDYDNLMYQGAWGALHEYNHHHQTQVYPFTHNTDWGVGYVDEITNNVLNAISYVYLTDIATTRSETTIFNDWRAVSDPYANYNRLAAASANTAAYEKLDANKLFGFTDIMHTFGADRFLEYLRAMYGYVEVEGYKGTNLTQDAYLRTQDGYALFTSLFYKTDFVDYFTKVWHFELSSGVIKQIKSYGFDEYFSLNNLYSAGVKGVETGRPYKVSASETTVLNFKDYTNGSVDNYVLDSISKPSHGTLKDNGDGTYSYTPGAGFTQDSIDLVYKVTIGSKVYYRTLVVKLESNDVESVKTPVYPSALKLGNKYLNKFYGNNYGLNYSAYASDDEFLNYSGAWKEVDGNYTNGAAKYSENGTVSFSFSGSDITLYSINEASTITIDGVQYEIPANDKLRTASFSIEGLTDMKHSVTITANKMTVDLIKTTGNVSPAVNFATEQESIVVSDQVYNGEKLRPILSYKGVVLTEGVDYFVTRISNNQNIGVATFSVKGMNDNTGEFSGSFNIQVAVLNNTNVTVTHIEDLIFEGEALKPQFAVTAHLNGQEVVLKVGTDYDFSYLNNDALGTATIRIQFKGNYTGVASGYFNLVEKVEVVAKYRKPIGFTVTVLILGGITGGLIVGAAVVYILLTQKKKTEAVISSGSTKTESGSTGDAKTSPTKTTTANAGATKSGADSTSSAKSDTAKQSDTKTTTAKTTTAKTSTPKSSTPKTGDTKPKTTKSTEKKDK